MDSNAAEFTAHSTPYDAEDSEQQGTQLSRAVTPDGVYAYDGDESYDHLCKILILGDTAVGKSNMLSQYTKNAFTDVHRPTIGVETSPTIVRTGDRRILTQLWDTASAAKFRPASCRTPGLLTNAAANTPRYYREAHGALIVYDVCERKTFENAIKVWLPELRHYTDPMGVPVILVGNKADKGSQRAVSTEEGQRAADEHKFGSFLETSALEASNIEAVFQSLVDAIYCSAVFARDNSDDSTVTAIHTSAVAAPQAICKQGMGTKEGYWVRNWKRRSFCLNASTLQYYNPSQLAQLKGTIPLTLITDVCEAGPHMHVVTQDQTYKIVAEGCPNSSWVTAIQHNLCILRGG